MTSLIAVILNACGGSGTASLNAPAPLPPTSPSPSGLLVGISEDNSLVAGFRRSIAPLIDSSNDNGSIAAPGLELAAPSLEIDAGGFTTTYRLEDQVDELDVVKYDGQRLFVAPTRGGACCFEVEPAIDALALLPPPTDGPNQVRILSTNPVDATAQQLGAIELSGGATVEGLFVNGDQLTTVTSTAWWGYHGDNFTSLAAWEDQSVGITLHDVGDPNAIALDWELTLEGALVVARQVANRVLLVTRHYPNIPELVLGTADPESQATNEAILESLQESDLLPQVRINGEHAASTITEQDCLVVDPTHPLAPSSPGYPVMTSLLLIDLELRAVVDAQCYGEPSDGVYVSPNAVYLAQSVYDEPNLPESIVHRFDLGSEFTYRGSARIEGSLLGRSQADFRMSERNDVLRLVTTRWNRNEEDRLDHFLYTLRPNDSEFALEQLARLPENEDDTPIGKPNEDLFGVRFVGDRAYLVTFEQIDPLYVIDLGDASRPKILGELEIPGFSDLLHPVSDALLLGLGADAEGTTKLELFNVGDPSNPKSQGVLTLGEGSAWAWSEARYDRRAFTYLAGTNGVDRLAVPLSVAFEGEEGQYMQEEQLHMFEIAGLSNPPTATLLRRGILQIAESDAFNPRPRSVLDEDAVFFVLGEQVFGGFWGTNAQALGPF
ncbi:MAG: beta-propeller domain-containing protein [Pseudomonadota bacterium]